jgi:tape measure domain-containing protein
MKMEPAIKLMRELANNMASMGKGATEIERVNYQLIQMKSKGIPQLEDLRVIQEAMPNINEIIRKAFGSTDIEGLVKGGLNADKFIAGITEAMSKQERATTGARNAQDNFNDSLFQFKAALGESVLPAITEFLTKTTSMLDKFNALPEATQKAISGGMMVGGGLLGVGLAIGGIATIIPSAVSGITALGGAFTTLSTIIMANPLAAAALGIGVAGGALALGAQSTTVQDWLYGKPEKPKALTLDEAKTQATKINVKRLGQIPMTPYSKGAIAETPKTLQDWIDWQKSWGGDKTFSGDVFPAYSGEYLKSTQRTNTPYSPYDTYKGAFSGTMTGTVPLNAYQPYSQRLRSGAWSPGLLEPSQSMVSGEYGPFQTDMIDSQRLNLQNKIAEGEKAILADQREIMKGWENGIDDFGNSWDKMTEEMLGGLDDIGTSWQDTAQQIMQTGMIFGDVINTVLAELGYDMSGWRYKDPELERQRQEQMKANARETTPIGWFNKIMGWANQAVGSVLPMTMAEGGSGIVSKPTIFMAGEAGAERFSFEPIGKGGRSGMGGTHIEIHNINMPNTMDRAVAENIVVTAYNDAVSHGRIG